MNALALFLFLLCPPIDENAAPPPKPKLEETIVVSGIRADETTPVTKSNIEHADIARDYHQQDVPLLMAQTPSINTYTESGIGSSGYAYITLRGVSPTRLNFTLDGVPLADSEDMGVYFADFPDLAHSLQSIQIQRGVGTSTFGSPSFGGSVNLESIDLAQTSSTEARVSAGAYGQRFATVGYQSGMTPSGFALYSRLSVNHTDGFREHSGVDQHNLFISAEKLLGDAQLKLTGFTAHERQQMSFNASDEETLRTNLRDNPLGPDDRDSFGYDLANLQYIRALTPSTNMTASAYYQAGYGWYSLSGDRYALDGRLLGSMLTMSWTRGAMSASYGLHANHFKREHTLDLAAVPAIRRISHLPVIIDPSHGTGNAYMVTPLARAGVAVGADGLMVEVHNHPELALSDGAQALTPAQYAQLIDQVSAIREISVPNW